ncbi:ABC transporter substrate-binding protein [Oceanobacillus salinisoli]|uniref:ABC transporter substrate-binding protein n=1 Tax=Oceanobacillus salinisoli TaxID=2678611 RepID=UPI0012E0CA77|nr:extracellular solute-binding protein [Oceanobacillus salinisoli]
MNKKIILALTSIAMLVLLAACGNADANTASGTEDSGKVTLTMWYWGDESPEIEAKVNEQFDNVELKVEKLPSGEDFKTRLQTTLAGGGEGPDIVAMDSWISEFLPHHDMFVDLYDYGAEELEDTYLEWKLEMATAKTDDGDKLIALPIDIGPIALYYRADLFEQAGLPSEPEDVAKEIQNWDDYIAASKKVYEATGAKMYTIDEIYRNVIGQSDKLYFDENDNFIADQEHVKNAFDTAVRAYQEGLTFVSESGSEKRAAMNTGDVGSLIHAMWFKGDVVNSAPDHAGNWRIAFPPGGGGNQGGSFMGILNSSEHPEEAYEVLKWYLNPENQLDNLVNHGLFPSTPEVYDAPEMQVEEEFFGGQVVNEVFAQSAEDVKIAYRSPNDSLVESSILEQFQLIVNENKDPEKAWNDAIDRAKSQLSK